MRGALSLDVRYDRAFAPGWRAVFADRLDMNRSYGATGDGNVNTVKEAYLSWQASPERIADFGRINVRNGVAMGYNPTDVFRAGAIRSASSIDPASLRENRLGSVMLRGQALWQGGSLTALVSPKLADAPNSGAWNLDLGATNRRNRWQVALSQSVSKALNPQVLLSGGEGESAQLGFNLSALANDATVVFFEWSGGRSRSLRSQALGGADDSAFRNRLATGLTTTTADNLSLTFEVDYNGAGLDRDALERVATRFAGRLRALPHVCRRPPGSRHAQARVFLRELDRRLRQAPGSQCDAALRRGRFQPAAMDRGPLPLVAHGSCAADAAECRQGRQRLRRHCGAAHHPAASADLLLS